jgi:hypothetical protein
MAIPETPIPETEYERMSGQTYVTDSLLEQYHTTEGAGRFRRWSIQATQMLIHGKSVYFPADYEKWIAAGLPDESSAD